MNDFNEITYVPRLLENDSPFLSNEICKAVLSNINSKGTLAPLASKELLLAGKYLEVDLRAELKQDQKQIESHPVFSRVHHYF